MDCGRARPLAITVRMSGPLALLLSGLLASLMSAAGISAAARAQGLAIEPKSTASAPLLAVAPSGALERPAATASLGAAEGAAATAPGPQREQNRATPSRYPLWSLPLRELTAGRERPIFSPTRRPPPASEAPAPVRLPSSANEIARPPLSLIGAIAADEAGMAIFLDQASQRTVRLKVGEGYAGWTLQLVKAREATLIRDQQTAILALPPPH